MAATQPNRFSAVLKDDAGRSIKLDGDQRQRLRDTIRHWPTKGEPGYLSLCVQVLVSAILFIAAVALAFMYEEGRYFGVRVDVGWPWLIGMWGVSISLAGSSLRHYRIRVDRDAIVKEWVITEGLCPVCTYELYEREVEADGCVSCLKCRSRWRPPEDRWASRPPPELAERDDRGRRLRAGGWSPAGKDRWFGRAANVTACLGLIAFGVGALALPGVEFGLWPDRLPRGDFWLFGWLGGMILIFVSSLFVRRWGRRRTAFFDKRCYSCGFDMGELSVEDDGCTVCPECGAAWRLPEPPNADA